MNEPEFLTLPEVAARLRVNIEFVRNLVANGCLPSVRVSPRVTRVRRDIFESMLANGTQWTTENLSKNVGRIKKARGTP